MGNRPLAELDESAFCAVHNKFPFLCVEVNLHFLALCVVEFHACCSQSARCNIHLKLESVLLALDDVLLVGNAFNVHGRQCKGVFAQCLHFRSNVVGNIQLAVCACVELQFARQSVCAAILLDGCNVGILPVAHPRNGENAVRNT